MEQYRHHVSGFFAHRDDADGARSRLLAQGLAPERVQLFSADSAPLDAQATGQNTEVLTRVIKDGVIGTSVGAGIGALAEVALVASSVTLFVASPLIAPLAMLGWGASLGGVVGAMVGSTRHAGKEHGKKDGKLSSLVHDAILSGQVVLVADTRSEAETVLARDIIHTAVGECNDVKVD
jgi:hypothetical protein